MSGLASLPPAKRQAFVGSAGPATASTTVAACPNAVTVVTATSFAPALRKIAAPLATGHDCVTVRVIRADGENAASVAAAVGADAWIPDDPSWATMPNPVALANRTGRVIATSPLYFVTRAGAPALPATARSWLGLARLLAKDGAWHLVLRDPAAVGDGMAAAGGLASAVVAADGPLVSALDLFQAWTGRVTDPVSKSGLPSRSGQVGIVPEYALLDAGAAGYTVVAPADGTTLLNYTWYPTEGGIADPGKAAALARIYQALTAPPAARELAAAGLRGSDWRVRPARAHGLPAATAAAMGPISEHFMYHVLATWHAQLRRSNMLIVLDVSGSMYDPAPGTHTAKIDVVRRGIAQVRTLLPDTARLGLWQFGSQLAPPHDWQALVSPAPLTAQQRAAISAAAARLHARPTGTGLYDTILGAYRYQQAHYQPDMPNEVVIFTDGVNEDDPRSISLAQLRAGLAATDRAKRVQLSIFGIGRAVPADLLNPAVAPVGGQVDTLLTRDQVVGAFVHAVSGALSGVPG